jgi:hypothetical protein
MGLKFSQSQSVEKFVWKPTVRLIFPLKKKNYETTWPNGMNPNTRGLKTDSDVAPTIGDRGIALFPSVRFQVESHAGRSIT